MRVCVCVCVCVCVVLVVCFCCCCFGVCGFVVLVCFGFVGFLVVLVFLVGGGGWGGGRDRVGRMGRGEEEGENSWWISAHVTHRQCAELPKAVKAEFCFPQF